MHRFVLSCIGPAKMPCAFSECSTDKLSPCSRVGHHIARSGANQRDHPALGPVRAGAGLPGGQPVKTDARQRLRSGVIARRLRERHHPTVRRVVFIGRQRHEDRRGPRDATGLREGHVRIRADELLHVTLRTVDLLLKVRMVSERLHPLRHSALAQLLDRGARIPVVVLAVALAFADEDHRVALTAILGPDPRWCRERCVENSGLGFAEGVEDKQAGL